MELWFNAFFYQKMELCFYFPLLLPLNYDDGGENMGLDWCKSEVFDHGGGENAQRHGRRCKAKGLCGVAAAWRSGAAHVAVGMLLQQHWSRWFISGLGWMGREEAEGSHICRDKKQIELSPIAISSFFLWRLGPKSHN